MSPRWPAPLPPLAAGAPLTPTVWHAWQLHHQQALAAHDHRGGEQAAPLGAGALAPGGALRVQAVHVQGALRIGGQSLAERGAEAAERVWAALQAERAALGADPAAAAVGEVPGALAVGGAVQASRAAASGLSLGGQALQLRRPEVLVVGPGALSPEREGQGWHYPALARTLRVERPGVLWGVGGGALDWRLRGPGLDSTLRPQRVEPGAYHLVARWSGLAAPPTVLSHALVVYVLPR